MLKAANDFRRSARAGALTGGVALFSCFIACGHVYAAEASAYDMGYAVEAAKVCENLSLVVAPPAVLETNSQFAQGAATVQDSVKAGGAERACRFAKRLYDTETGKVAPLLKSN